MFSDFGYSCPHCKSDLKDDYGIKFQVEKSNKQQTTLYLSPLPEDYAYKSVPEVSFEKGERLIFRCCSCNMDLQSAEHPNLVHIHLKVTDSILFDVLFSPICGDKQSFIDMEGELESYSGNFFTFKHLQKTG